MKILIIKLGSFGDIMHAFPTATALRKRFPEARIDWLVEEYLQDLVRMHPDVDGVIPLPKANLAASVREMRGLGAALQEVSNLFTRFRRARYDYSIDLQGMLKSGILAVLVGARRRVGYPSLREMSFLFSRPARINGDHQHVVEKYLSVMQFFGDRGSEVEFRLRPPEEALAWARDLVSQTNGPTIVVAPGSRWGTKQWPPDRYSRLVDLLIENQGAQVLLCGGKSDGRLVEDILSRMKHSALDLTGETTLTQLAALLTEADLLVGGDSGPLHLAAAAGTRVVAIIGPTDPARNGPFSASSIVVQHEVPCWPCRRRVCDHHSCMAYLETETVYSAASRLLLSEAMPVPQNGRPSGETIVGLPA